MRVLLISAFFPPLNNIASQRAGAFEKYLRQQGIEVDVLTRYYDAERSRGASMHVYQDAASGLEQPYIKKENVVYTGYDAVTPVKRRFEKLPPGIRGLYAYMKMDVYSYGWIDYLVNAFQAEFAGNHYDFIIASYGPPVALLAARKISKRYGIPVIADYRDIFINEQDRGHHLFLKKKQQQFLLAPAAGILFVSTGMNDFFRKHAAASLRKKPALIVMNGVEDEVLDPVLKTPDHPVVDAYKKLVDKYGLILLHTGTLYPGQNIGVFMEGLKQYNASATTKAAMVFLGFADDIRDKKPLEQDHVYFLEKVESSVSIYLQQQAHVLVLPVWEGRYTGFSGKLLEYLAAENIVISGPGMQADVVDFMKGYENVYQAGSADDIAALLHGLAVGQIGRKKAQPGQLDRLRRSHWVRQLAVFLETLKKQHTSK